MIPLTHMKGCTLYVYGLGHTGQTAVAALLAGGAQVWAFDDLKEAREVGIGKGARIASPDEIDWSCIDAVVLSPGIPFTHPEPHDVVNRALERAIPVIGDTELFINEIAIYGDFARLVGVTGTNGKSTTTALIGHLLSHAGIENQVGGNIGSQAVLELSLPINPVVYVIELSSYQIDLTPHLKPDVAVFLNVSPDHLGRHGGMEGYIDAKAGILLRQSAGDVLVLGQDDVASRALSARVSPKADFIPISQNKSVAGGVWVDGMRLIDGRGDNQLEYADLSNISSLRGEHNFQNAAAASAVLMGLGISTERFSGGFKSFLGLAHRMEQIARAGAVLFINDSKATNAEATERALSSYQSIHWIAGGQAKGGGIASLSHVFERIEKAYLIGEAAEAFAATLQAHDVMFEIHDGLDAAVDAAARGAFESSGMEPAVLLSPAAASFDHFKNFEMRGDAFRAAVMQWLDKLHLAHGER